MKRAAGLALLITAMPVLAADPVRTERVQFATGTSSKTMKGSLKGYATVNYLVGLRAGQTLTVSLTSPSSFTYFVIVPPGADSAMYDASINGNSYSGVVKAGGDYRIQLFMMRAAARRGATVAYSVAIGAR